MPYSKDELKSELLRCYQNEGRVTTKILNSKDNDYPTQPTYYNYFGSLKNAKKSVGIIAGHTRERVLSDIKKCYNNHGEVSVKALDNDDEFVDYRVVNKHFGSLSKAVESANISWNDARTTLPSEPWRKYADDDLIQNLLDCKESEGDTKTSTINNFDGPTSKVYRDRFGSITNAREEAGIVEDFKNGSNGKVKQLLDSIDFSRDANALIYVLRISVNGEPAYYVGETTNIEKRLTSHVYQTKIQSWAHGPHGKILAPREETNNLNEINVDSIEYVIELYQKEDESDIDFRRRRKYKEHHEHLSVAIDKNTLEVYGGR